MLCIVGYIKEFDGYFIGDLQLLKGLSRKLLQ